MNLFNELKKNAKGFHFDPAKAERDKQKQIREAAKEAREQQQQQQRNNVPLLQQKPQFPQPRTVKQRLEVRNAISQIAKGKAKSKPQGRRKNTGNNNNNNERPDEPTARRYGRCGKKDDKDDDDAFVDDSDDEKDEVGEFEEIDNEDDELVTEVNELEEVIEQKEQKQEFKKRPGRAEIEARPEFKQFGPEWLPPAWPREWDKNKDVNIQMYHIDTYNSSIQNRFCHFEREHGDIADKAPVIRMFGATNEGHTTAVHVHGFKPYMYAKIPEFILKKYDDAFIIKTFHTALESRLSMMETKVKSPLILKIEIVEASSIYGFDFNKKQKFLKITTCLPAIINKLRSLLTGHGLGKAPPGGVQRRNAVEDNKKVDMRIHGPLILFGTPLNLECYECNIPFVMRYMIDNNLNGMEWFTMKGGKYDWATPNNKWACKPQYNEADDTWETKSFYTNYFSLEAHIWWEDIECHPYTDPKWSHNAPMRIFSWDIECQSLRPPEFPKADKDPIIDICFELQTSKFDKSVYRNCGFTWKDLDKVKDMNDAFVARDEKQMLEWICDLFRQTCWAFMTGWNVINFDLPFFSDRCKILGVEFGDIIGGMPESMRIEKKIFNSRASGARERNDISIPGGVMYDMHQVIQAAHKLPSYTLNFASGFFLKQQKDDVHHSDIGRLFCGTNAERAKLMHYCLQDTRLPTKMMAFLQKIVQHTEMVRVTGVTIDMLLKRGEGIKTLSQILRFCKDFEKLFVEMTEKYKGKNFTFVKIHLLVPWHPEGKRQEGIQYEGATVLEPKRGFYAELIATLDFNSLYPSIMIAYNLCYSTVLLDGAHKLLDPNDYYTFHYDSEDKTKVAYFVKPHIRKGVVPLILQKLLDARKVAKGDMAAAKKEKIKYQEAAAAAKAAGDKKAETEANEKAIFYAELEQIMDGRQNALKISANAIYGFFSAYMLFLMQVGAVVTYLGRMHIEQTKKFIEKYSTPENGFEQPVNIIYGDTDSVMMKMNVKINKASPGEDIRKALKLALKLEKMCNTAMDDDKPGQKMYPDPMKIELEKVS
jgi:DNA polymerase delta subunit 1